VSIRTRRARSYPTSFSGHEQILPQYESLKSGRISRPGRQNQGKGMSVVLLSLNGISSSNVYLFNAKKNSIIFVLFHQIKLLLVFFFRLYHFQIISFIDSMQVILLFVLCFFVLIVDGNKKVCLHNETKGKHCISTTQRSGQRIIKPTASQNKKCNELCNQTGYKGGGHCSISKNCFRFCSCRS
jgi:hypothetical protein